MNDSENALSMEEIMADTLNGLKMDTKAILSLLQPSSTARTIKSSTEDKTLLESLKETLSDNLPKIYEKMKDLPQIIKLQERISEEQNLNQKLTYNLNLLQNSKNKSIASNFKDEVAEMKAVISSHRVVKSDWRAWVFGAMCLVIAVFVGFLKITDRDAITAQAQVEAGIKYFPYLQEDWTLKKNTSGNTITLTKKNPNQ